MAQTSKKLYKAVAAEIAKEYDRIKEDNGGFYSLVSVSHIAMGLAHIFAADNPNFDYARFYDACLNENVGEVPMK